MVFDLHPGFWDPCANLAIVAPLVMSLNLRSRGVILLVELAIRMRAGAVDNAWAVMAIDAIVHIALLAPGARVQPCQERNGHQLLFGGLVIVFEVA